MPATAFKILTGAVDALEDIDGERIGGSDGAYAEAIRRMEAAALSIVGDDGASLTWKVRRLIRAVVCEWEPQELGPICASVLAELRALALEVVQ